MRGELSRAEKWMLAYGWGNIIAFMIAGFGNETAAWVWFISFPLAFGFAVYLATRRERAQPQAKETTR